MLKSNKEIKDMKFLDLHTYLDQLRIKGYDVPDVSDFKDTQDGRLQLRIIVNNLQKKGPRHDYVPSRENKEDDESDSLDDCQLYASKTDCTKKATAQEVKEASQKCRIDIKTYKTKQSQCDELDKLLEKLKQSKKNVVYKKFNDSKEYIKLDKLTKQELVDMATNLDIKMIKQGDVQLVLKLANKQSIILAILEKNNKSKPSSTPETPSPSMPPPLPSMPPPFPSFMPPSDSEDSDDDKPLPSMPPPLPSSMPPIDEDSDDDKPLQRNSKNNEEVCFDFKLKDFMNLTPTDAKNLLNRNGITSFPDSRERQFYYLCAKQDLTKQCKPDDYSCPDGLVCDISNDQGLCVNKNEEYPDTYMYKGKTIVGSIESIKKLKDSIENSDKEPLIQTLLKAKYKGRDRKYFEEKDIKTLSKYVDRLKQDEEPEEKDEEPEEQSNVDFEDLLSEVIEGDKDGEELKKTRKYVFKCLGLLS